MRHFSRVIHPVKNFKSIPIATRLFNRTAALLIIGKKAITMPKILGKSNNRVPLIRLKAIIIKANRPETIDWYFYKLKTGDYINSITH